MINSFKPVILYENTMARPRKYNEANRCPECDSNWVVKDGKAHGKQQNKCKACGRRFTEKAISAKYPQSVRNEVITLHHEGMSFGFIAQTKNIKRGTIFQWIKNHQLEEKRINEEKKSQHFHDM